METTKTNTDVELFESDRSGALFPLSEQVVVRVGWRDYENWSQDEADEFATHCDDCGELVSLDYTTYMGNLERRVCNDCRDDNYVQCERCGDWMLSRDAHYDNDDDPYCDDCYDEDHPEGICSYHAHKGSYVKRCTAGEVPDKVFGFELETQKNDNTSETARVVSEWSDDNDDLLVMEEDGSLDDGVEIISHPMTWKYFRQKDWDGLFDSLKNCGTRAWDGGEETGLHIHLSRDFFDNKQHLGAFMYFIAYNYDHVIEVAGRGPNSYCFGPDDWSSTRVVILDQLCGAAPLIRPILYSKLAEAKQYSRYDSINTANRETVEMRMFRSSLNTTRFYNDIKFCLYAIDYAREIMYGDRTPLWRDFMNYTRESSAYED